MDILKFNNKYLKCVVTKYMSASMHVMANSGALIVYQPEHEITEDDQHRNYIYLGDEFLASGYGFLNKDMRDKAERIVAEYDNTIQRLDEQDANETSERKRKDEELLEEIKKYVAKNGGVINNTVVEVGEYKIKTEDIILYGEEAHYDNLKVNKIDVLVNNTYKLNTDDTNIYVPIGLKINSIDVYVNYNANDSGGINKLYAVHNKNFIGDDDNTEYEKIVINYNQDTSNAFLNESLLHYSKEFNTSLYAIDALKDVISEFYIEVKETPVEKYKNYPSLEKVYDIKIKSIGNIIRENRLKILKNINIVPQYFLYYQLLNTQDSNDIITYSTLESSTMMIDNINDESICKILITDKNKDIIYLAIPNNYCITELYGVNDLGEHHNWSGSIVYDADFSCFNKNINNGTTYKRKLFAYKNNAQQPEYEENYILDFNVYKISADSSIKFKDSYIEIHLLDKYFDNKNYKYKNISDELIKRYRTGDANYPEDVLSLNFNSSINNELFNSIYWVSVDNDTPEQINSILNKVIEKGC